MIKISLIKWLIHFFGFKKSAIDATFTSIELSKSTTQAYNATSEALEVVKSIGSLAKGVSTAAKTFEDKMEEVRKSREASREIRHEAFMENLIERRKLEHAQHIENMAAIKERKAKLEARPDYVELEAWINEARAEVDALIAKGEQKAKLENNKPKVIKNKAKAKDDVFK